MRQRGAMVAGLLLAAPGAGASGFGAARAGADLRPALVAAGADGGAGAAAAGRRLPGRADGVWGPDSQAALERFQQARGLQVTGQLNQATAATLGLDP